MTHSSAHIQTVRRYNRDIYGEYGSYYYVPMSEAFTVQSACYCQLLLPEVPVLRSESGYDLQGAIT